MPILRYDTIQNALPGVLMQPFGPIIYKTDITAECLDRLTTLTANSRNNDDMRPGLAGNLSDEKLLNIDDASALEIIEHCGVLQTALWNMPKESMKHFTRKMLIDNIWVNYQKAFEWNPLHSHTGDISFVIYIANPIDYELEKKHPTQRANTPTAGKISFRYGEKHPMSNHTFMHIPVAGEMFCFPAWLEHQVFPFTTEGIERISIAGNISINN
jgi:hypothetical protein